MLGPMRQRNKDFPKKSKLKSQYYFPDFVNSFHDLVNYFPDFVNNFSHNVYSLPHIVNSFLIDIE